MPLGRDPAVTALQEFEKGQLNPGSNADQIDPYLGDKNDQRKRSILTQDENELDPEASSGADVSAMIVPASMKSEQLLSDADVGLGQKQETLLSDADVGIEKPVPPQHPTLLQDITDAFKDAGESLKELGSTPKSIEELLPDIKKKWIEAGVTPEEAERQTQMFAQKTRRMQMTSNLPITLLSAAAAPLMGTYRHYISRPLSEMTGAPMEVIEGLAMIGGAVYGAFEMPMARPLESVKPSPIKPVEGSPNPNMPRTEVAQKNISDPLLVSVLNDPTMKEVINNPVVDRSKSVPNSWGGSEKTNDATLYLDKTFPETVTGRSVSDPTRTVTIDTAEGAAVHENSEMFVMDILMNAGWDRDAALRFGYHEVGAPLEDAFYTGHDMDPREIEDKLAPHVDRIDKAADTSNLPENLYKQTYPDGDPAKAAPGEIPKPSDEEVTAGRAVLEQYFRDHPPENTLQEGQGLGVIGEPKAEPTITDSPSALAEAAIPHDLSAASTPEGQRGALLGHEHGEYDARGKEWIDKIDESEDVRDVIEKIATDHDYFPEARGGVASEASRLAVAEAAGVNPADIDRSHFASHFDNDGKVRAVIQVLRQTTKDFMEASEKAAKEPTMENIAAATEAEMRHAHVLEYTMGLRAESGRTLAAWKDLLRQQEQAKAKIAIKAGEESEAIPRGTSSVVDAANDLLENLKNPGNKKKLGLQKLIDTAKALVDAEDKAGVRPAPLAPEIAGLIGEARKTLKALSGGKTDVDKTVLGKLVDQAERQAVNMTKAKAVKNPAEALPPEIQALIDKTNRIVDSFGGTAKGERAALLLGRTGRTAVEQEQLVNSVRGLSPNQVAKVLNKLRTSAMKDQPGWFFWLWQQGLISGLVTHSGYFLTNIATVYTERVISPLLAAGLGKARGQNVSVMGPLYANIAMIHALPDAFAGAFEAARTGNRVPLASEMRLFARGEESPQTKGAGAAFTPPGPNWGMWKRVFNEDQLDVAAKGLGIPGRSANALHTFFKVLSEQAAGSTRAFEEAHQEGARGDKFWQRYQYHLDNPTDDALRGNVNDAYSGAFMAKLGEKTGEVAHTLGKNPILKWMFPFQHIPWNIVGKTIEYSPFAVLGPEMRSALMGEKGAPAQNLALAKMAVGSSVIGYFVHKALAGEATGDYPTDAKERRRWEVMGIQPNSIQINGYWVTYDRLGPPGGIAHMGASLGTIIKNYDGQDDKALAKAMLASADAAANQIGNETGFQSLKNLYDVLNGRQKFERFASYQASSFLYPSSFLRQNASFMDPQMRKAEGFIAGLKYSIPLLRETLPPKLDPLYGEPVANPAYHAIKRQSAVETDPVKVELDRLKVYPAAPKDVIGGVKLPPDLYDRYQELAGSLVKSRLEALIQSPKWDKMPSSFQADEVKAQIKTARDVAGQILQATRQDVVKQGIQDQKDKINGVKPGKLLPAAGVGAGPPDNLLTDIAKGISGMLPKEPTPTVAPNAGGGRRG